MNSQNARSRWGTEALLNLAGLIICLGFLLGSTSQTHAALIATFVDAHFSTSSTGVGEYDFASVSVFVDPSLTEWIAWNNTPDVVVADPGCTGGFCLGPDFFGTDDFIRFTVTNPAGGSLTIDIDQNLSGAGNAASFGPQNVIFGTAAAAPDVRRTGFGSTIQFFDEGGAFDSMFTMPGPYTFDFSFRDAFGGHGGHQPIYLLVSAVPEPSTLAFSLLIGAAYLLVHSRNSCMRLKKRRNR